jgi:hypothetical protein
MTNHELTRIKRIYYIFEMILLFVSFENYAFGCCDLICPPCEVPNLLCTRCVPTGCPSCGHWCCCPPRSCNNNTCCPSGWKGHGWHWGYNSGWQPICCPPETPEWCSEAWHCYNPETEECCGRDICRRSLCEECVNGQCLVCGGDVTKCCDPNHTCVKKCNPDGPCLFQWPSLETPPTGCANPDPTDKSCEQYIEGLICAWVAESYYLTSAECADCAPNCARNLVGFCVKLTPWKCNNDWIPFMGLFCVCNADDAGTPHDAGPHYTCLE